MGFNSGRLYGAAGLLGILLGCSGKYDAGLEPANSAGAAPASAGNAPVNQAGGSATGGDSAGDSAGNAGEASRLGEGGAVSVAGAPNEAGATSYCGVPLVSSPTRTFSAPGTVRRRLQLFVMVPPGATPPLPAITTREWAGDLAMSMLDAQGMISAPGMARFMASVLPGTPIDSTWGAFFTIRGTTLTDLLTTNAVRSPGSGILTDNAVLGQKELHITARGAFVRAQLLCSPVPPLPPGVMEGVLPPKAGQTRRQQLEEVLQSPACTACHALTDPLGFGLEHFDNVGAYSDLDNGSLIDSSGSLNLNSGLIAFQDANQMGAGLAGSCEVTTCMAQRMLADAEGSAVLSDVGSTDAAKVAAIAVQFANSGGDLRTLVRQVVQSDTFLGAP
ncbi:MAG: DUF1588 domain-containing protein [Polyangiaceae bacterium]